MSLKHGIFLFFLLSQNIYCAHSSSSEENAKMLSKNDAIDIGPGDVFLFEVTGEENLKQEVRVNVHGEATLPMVGTLHVAGMNTDDLRTVLTEKYTQFILRPYVVITLKEVHSKKIFVTGEVKNPGPIPFSEGLSIMQALSTAGGISEYASKKVVVNRRSGKTKERFSYSLKDIEKGDAPNILLKPDDIVYVPQSIF